MSKKILVVVDYQKDFVDGSLGFPKAVTLEEGIYNKCIDAYENGDSIVFTYDTHGENYLETREGKNLPVSHCILGTEGHELYGRLGLIAESTQPHHKIYHVNKPSFGYILPQDLIEELGGEEVVEIELVGVVTNICVISNAVTFQSAFPNASVVVDASLCASFDEELHEKALDIMTGLQVKVINR